VRFTAPAGRPRTGSRTPAAEPPSSGRNQSTQRKKKGLFMVNVDTALKTSMDSVSTPRIAPKTSTAELDPGGPTVSGAAPAGDAAADFRALFTSSSNPPAPAVPDPPKPAIPTALA